MIPARRLAPVLILLCAGPALSASSFGPGASARIPAGSVEVALLEPARGGVDERELVLSIDGGKSFPVRLTAEIGPGDLRALWRVPELPTERAVLALREGSRGSEEEIVASSAEFSILPGPGSAAEEFRFRDGEWKTREADVGDRSLPVASMGGTAPERCEQLILRSDGFEEPARVLLAAPHRQTAAGDAPLPADVAAGSPASPLSSLCLPLRE